MGSHTQTSSLFISSVRTDWQSSSSKRKKLVKSFSSGAQGWLRSSVVKVLSRNRNSLRLHYEILIWTGTTVTLWDSFEWNRFALLLGHVDVRKQFLSFVAQWMKMRWSSPWQIRRGHLWQQVEIKRKEQFKLSA